MALLYRFAQLHDRSGTRVFSFVVTRTVVRDPERDVTSKELVCGFQRWAVAFSRGEKVARPTSQSFRSQLESLIKEGYFNISTNKIIDLFFSREIVKNQLFLLLAYLQLNLRNVDIQLIQR